MRYLWYRLMPIHPVDIEDRVWITGWVKGHPERWYVQKNNISEALRRLVICDPRSHPGCILIEWDMAIDPTDIQNFERFIDRHLDQVCVAPYLVYPISTALENPVYTHRHDKSANYFVDPSDRVAAYFSWGLIWLPHEALFMAANMKPELRYPDHDILFSERWGKPAWIDWQTRPKHLHFGDVESVDNPRSIPDLRTETERRSQAKEFMDE